MAHHWTLPLACLSTTLLLAPVAVVRGTNQATSAARVVAVGDIHGAGDAFAAILRAAGLIDAGQKWAGGTTTFVQTGDYLDRGGAVRPVLDLLIGLEPQAKSAGGRVEVLLGNHEVMNMVRELTDVSAEAYASFADARSEDRRRKAYEAQLGIFKNTGAADPGPAGRVDGGAPSGLCRVRRGDEPARPLRQVAAQPQGCGGDRRHGVHARRHRPGRHRQSRRSES